MTPLIDWDKFTKDLGVSEPLESVLVMQPTYMAALNTFLANTSIEDIKTLIEVVNPSGVAIASLLHYEQTTILEIKEYLNNMMVSQ